MATVKHISIIAKILRKSGKNLQALVEDTGMDVGRVVDHASQLTDEQAEEFIKIYLKKGK